MSSNYQEQTWLSAARTPLLDVVNTIIACLAVLGNGMVITVMTVRRRVFSSFTNRLILHQSVIDSTAGVVFFLYKVVRNQTIVVSAEGNIYDQLACRLVASDFLFWCMNVTSTYNIVIISLERFIATCHPVRHRNTWSLAKLKFALVTSWAIGLAYALHLPFLFVPHQTNCQLVEMGFGWKMLHFTVSAMIEFVVPIIVLTYAYIKILFVLTKRAANPGNGHPNAVSNAKKNVLTTILLVGIMFLVCWTPVEVYFFIEHFSNIYGGLFYITFTGLVACNMFVNPIIYCFKYEHFRSQLKDLVMKRLRRNRVDNVESISIPTVSSRLH